MQLFSSSDKALWRLALPMILSNITVPLLGVVDTAVIGHLDSPIYLGGVAVGTTATSFIFMLLLFLRMSTTGLTAQAFGAIGGKRIMLDVLPEIFGSRVEILVVQRLLVEIQNDLLVLLGQPAHDL